MTALFDDDRPRHEILAALPRRGAAMEIRARVWRGMAELPHMRPALHDLAPGLLAEADRMIAEGERIDAEADRISMEEQDDG